MPDIFVSYATEDRERIRPLVDLLEGQGWSVWWDRELIAGPAFEDEIEAALANARCVLVAWSKHSVGSHWCRAEAAEGLERGILVPFSLDETKPPLSFRGAQTASLHGWPRERGEVESVLNGIRRRLQAELPMDRVQGDATDRADSSRRSRRAAVGAGVAAVLLTVAVAQWWSLSGGAPDAPAAGSTIAVLDLRNLTNDSALDWIAGGLTEELRVQISSWGRFDVLPGALTRGRRGTELDRPVDLLVDGFLRGDGQHLELALNVVDVATAETLLEETFRGSRDDPVHLQRQLAANVARVLNEGLAVASDYRGPSPEAYAAYLRVLHAANGDLDETVYWLEEAVALDPTWADGWARLSMRYVQLYQYFGDQAFADRARSALVRMQRLYGDQMPSGYSWFAWFAVTAFVDGNLRDVLPAVRAVTESGVYYPIALLMMNAGLFREADAALRHGTSLTPNDAALWDLRAYDAFKLDDRRTALDAAQRVAVLNPGDGGVSESIRAQVFAVAGRVEEARRLVERVDARYEGAPVGSLRQRLGDLALNPFRLAYAAEDRGMALSAADWMEQHDQPARAGLYRLLVGAERGEALIRRGIAQGPGYLRAFWYTDRVYVPADLSAHPAVVALEEALGYDAAWRRELCGYLATFPPSSHLACEPAAYEGV